LAIGLLLTRISADKYTDVFEVTNAEKNNSLDLLENQCTLSALFKTLRANQTDYYWSSKLFGNLLHVLDN